MSRDLTPTTGAPSRRLGPAEHRLGPYRLLRLLGKGGLGEVFEALGEDGTRLAIKVFRLQDDEQGLAAAAFVREASLGQRLRHPDIVRVFDSGCHGEYAYLAMEFVPGHDLRVHTRPAERLPLPELLRIVERVARATAAAHALNVIHRDLKPGNVLVHTPSNTVKVTDFGLARLGDAFRSRTGIIAGTPGYMSPEQLAEVPLGPASDLYALGVMLFELLTARLPHEASSLGHLLVSVSSRPAPRLMSLRRDVPAALDRLVAQLLERRPEDRPRSADALADQLAAIQAGLGSTS